MPCHAMHHTQDLFLESFSYAPQLICIFLYALICGQKIYSCTKWVLQWWSDHEGVSQPSLFFSRNKILSIFFGASVVTQNTLNFSRITRVLSNSREGDYSQYFQGRRKLSVFVSVSVVTQHTLRYSNLNQ
jgi:hypothetical protein